RKLSRSFVTRRDRARCSLSLRQTSRVARRIARRKCLFQRLVDLLVLLRRALVRLLRFARRVVLRFLLLGHERIISSSSERRAPASSLRCQRAPRTPPAIPPTNIAITLAIPMPIPRWILKSRSTGRRVVWNA